MQIFNSPWLALAILAGFMGLAGYSRTKAPEALTMPLKPSSQQEGYSKVQVAAMGRFVAFKVKEYDTIASYHNDLAALFNTSSNKE